MTLIHSPKIVTDNLYLYYDSNKSSCWDGVSSEIKDLSGNKNHGSALGELNLIDKNFNLKGTASSERDGISWSPISSSNISLDCWINFRSFYNSDNGGIPTLFAESSSSDRIQIGGDGSIRIRLNGSNISLLNPGFSINKWYNFVMTHNGSTYKLYLNSIFKTSLSNSTEKNWGHFGRLYSTNGSINAKVSNIKIYKKELSLEEIKLNYIMLKNRYSS